MKNFTIIGGTVVLVVLALVLAVVLIKCLVKVFAVVALVNACIGFFPLKFKLYKRVHLKPYHFR